MENLIIGRKVCFYGSSKRKRIYGKVLDKVSIPIASGTNEYVKMSQYVIENIEGELFIVNPIDLIETAK